jgi:hypothetical protein
MAEPSPRTRRCRRWKGDRLASLLRGLSRGHRDSFFERLELHGTANTSALHRATPDRRLIENRK